MKDERNFIFEFSDYQFKNRRNFFNEYYRQFKSSVGNTSLLKLLVHRFIFGLIRILTDDKAPVSQEFVFDGTKYKNLIKSLSNEKHRVLVLCTKIGDVIFCLKNRIDFKLIDFVTIKALKCKALTDKSERQKLLEQLNNMIEFDKNDYYNQYFIVSNTSLFRERYLLFVFRKNDYETMCIQHGLFQNSIDLDYSDGLYVDRFLAYSRSQVKIMDRLSDEACYKQKNVDFGYFEERKKSEGSASNTKDVVWIGQPFYLYSKTLHYKYMKAFVAFREYCRSLNMNLIYCVHPAETKCSYLDKIEGVSKFNFLKHMDSSQYFVSVSSTALIEVSLNSRIPIQIFIEDFDLDDYEELGICKSYAISELYCADIFSHHSDHFDGIKFDKLTERFFQAIR